MFLQAGGDVPAGLTAAADGIIGVIIGRKVQDEIGIFLIINRLAADKPDFFLSGLSHADGHVGHDFCRCPGVIVDRANARLKTAELIGMGGQHGQGYFISTVGETNLVGGDLSVCQQAADFFFFDIRNAVRFAIILPKDKPGKHALFYQSYQLLV